MKKMLLIFFFISSIFCEEVTYYISPNGSKSNDGKSREKPLNWDPNNILKVTYNVYDKNNEINSFKIIFLEGDYYVDGYGLTMSGSSPKIYYRFWADEGARVRIIGGKKLQALSYYSLNPKIWTTQVDPSLINNTASNLIFNNRRITLARSPKSWSYDRLWGYYTTDDAGNSAYLRRHYIVSSELVKILAVLPKEQLKKAYIVCKHHYHTETDAIIAVDTVKNEIITNATKYRENYISALPIEKDALFYVENVMNFLTEPNEYIVLQNGTLFVYPEDDDEIETSEVFLSTTGYFGIHSNWKNNAYRGNFEAKNIEIYATSGYGVYLSNSQNISLINLTIHQCGGGVSIQACKNITIDHTYIYDVIDYGQYITKSDYIISNNNIIRYFVEGHGIEVSDCNNTELTKNEVAAGYAAGIMVKAHSKYDMDTIRKILVQDNHVHHIGFGINNDIGGIQVLMATNGLIIDHNHFHDIWTESYAGHGIYLGSATAGTICTNNLVHDTSVSFFKIDLGRDITLENNIWAFGGSYGFAWTTNVPEYHEFNIHKNIAYINSGLLYMGAFKDTDADMTIDNNIYWHSQKGADGIVFRYENITQWRARGYDINGFLEDPLFTDPENRDFTFKSKEVINKIGFEEFDLTFGVTGEEYWLELANGKQNNIFHENQVLPPSIFFTSGSTNFDIEEDNDSFLKNCTISPHSSTIEKSTEQKYSGEYSLRFAKASKAAHSNQRPEISVPCNYEQGHGTFSFRFYVNNIYNQIQVYFDTFLYITISSGKIDVNGNQLTYEANTWNYLIINIDFGDSKTKKTYDIELNGIKYTGSEISYSTLSKFGIQIIKSDDDTFIDDLTCKTDYEIPRYFRNTFNENSEILGTPTKFEDLVIQIEESESITDSEKSKASETENINEKEENDGLSTGAIVGITLSSVAVVSTAAALIIYIIKKKKGIIEKVIQYSNNELEPKELKELETKRSIKNI